MTDMQVDQLRSLWRQGLSITQISDVMGLTEDTIKEWAYVRLRIDTRRPHIGLAWSDEREETLRRMWPTHSASAIAKVLGGLSRSAVIGKAHRLCLESKKGKYPENHAERSRTKRRPGKHQSLRNKLRWDGNGFVRVNNYYVRPDIDVPMPVPGGVRLIDLERHHCRAVIGTDKEDGLARFCGSQKAVKPVLRGNGWVPELLAYCPTHASIFYR